MSTNSAHEPFWAHLPWLKNWFQQQQRDSGWQRERVSDEMPVLPMQYPLHQHEVPQMPGAQPPSHHGQRFIEWLDAQPVLRPRLVTDTHPKLRERAGHIQEIEPQIVQYRPRTTDGMQRLAPATPIPEAQQAETLAPMPGLPRWLVGATPAGDLPVERQHSADVQMTLPYSNHHVQDVKPLTVLELPEWMGAVKVSRPLPMELGFSDPDLVPDLPTEPHKPEDFAEHSWLYGDLKLDPMVSGEIAAVDKTASYIAPSAIDQLATLASQQPDDDTVEVPSVTRMRHTKESE